LLHVTFFLLIVFLFTFQYPQAEEWRNLAVHNFHKNQTLTKNPS
jgi:hypothetical protein